MQLKRNARIPCQGLMIRASPFLEYNITKSESYSGKRINTNMFVMVSWCNRWNCSMLQTCPIIQMDQLIYKSHVFACKMRSLLIWLVIIEASRVQIVILERPAPQSALLYGRSRALYLRGFSIITVCQCTCPIEYIHQYTQFEGFDLCIIGFSPWLSPRDKSYVPIGESFC